MNYHVAVKELYYALYGTNPTNFHAILYRLIGKADPANRAKLRLAFPIEVLVWEEWYKSDNEIQFFAKFGFKPHVLHTRLNNN